MVLLPEGQEMIPGTGSLQDLLDYIRTEYGSSGMEDQLHQLYGLKVLVIGEIITDIYDYVLPMGKTPKENIIATKFQSEKMFRGGVSATAAHLYTFCHQVDTVSWKRNLIKRRFVDPTYTRKLFEVCEMDDSPITSEEEAAILASLHDVHKYDVVVINDFGHGMISDRIKQHLYRNAVFIALNVQSNSANMGFNLMRNYDEADYVCLDALEARLSVCDRHSDLEDVIEKLAEQIRSERFVITHGKNGCITRNGETCHIPAVTGAVTDTMGAGDAFLAITAPLVSLGVDMRVVGFLGNIAGAMKTAIVGHERYITKDAMIDAIKDVLND